MRIMVTIENLPDLLEPPYLEVSTALSEAYFLRSPYSRLARAVGKAAGFEISVEDIKRRVQRAKEMLKNVLAELEREV